MTFEPKFGTGDSCRSTVVWCRHSAGNDRIGAFSEGVREQKFKFSDFVSGKRSAGLVISFNEKFHIRVSFVKRCQIPGLDRSRERAKLKRLNIVLRFFTVLRKNPYFLEIENFQIEVIWVLRWKEAARERDCRGSSRHPLPHYQTWPRFHKISWAFPNTRKNWTLLNRKFINYNQIFKPFLDALFWYAGNILGNPLWSFPIFQKMTNFVVFLFQLFLDKKKLKILKWSEM